MKKIILLFTLLSVFLVWNCSDKIEAADEWSSSARTWEDKLGDYRGTLDILVDGLAMDTVVQQVSFVGDNYNRVSMSIEDLYIQDKRYGTVYFTELSFKEENGVINIKGTQNSPTSTSFGLVTFDIVGKVKNNVLSFDLTINGVDIKELQLNMRNARMIDKFPNSATYIEKAFVVEEDLNRPFITGTPAISSHQVTIFVADSLTITDSTFFCVRPKFELSPGAWIEPDPTMNWTVTHNTNPDIKDAPSIATTDSLYRFTEKLDMFGNRTMYFELKVWAEDSINFREYRVTYAKSNAIKISLFHWETRDGYREPIAGWATNNGYFKTLSKDVPLFANRYATRVLGGTIGEIGATVRTGVTGTVKDSNVVVVSGKLFRGVFNLDSLNTPKNGELHGVPFSKRKPVSLRGQFKYIPGSVLYLGDSILPDSIKGHTDSCYIEAFLYESPTADSYLDSLDLDDRKIVGHAKFVSGKSYEFRDFSMNFKVRNWVPNRRYHLGIVCRSSGKDEYRVGAQGSELTVSGFEIMSTQVLNEY